MGIHHLWFLLMMVGVFIIVIGIGRRIIDPRFICLLFIFFYVSSLAVNKFLPQLPNYISWKNTIFYMPAFLCGIATIALNLSERINKWKSSTYYISLTVIMISLLLMGSPLRLPLKNLYLRLVIYLWLLFLYTLLSYKIKLGIKSKLIDGLDRHSMSIYIIHHILIWAIMLYVPPTLPFMQQHYILAPIIMFVTIFTISWGIAELSSHYRITNYLLTGKSGYSERKNNML